jgi:hypothetical protein
MTPRLALLGLLLTAPAARAQTMIDAAAAGAIQGSLQGASTPSYLGALQRSRQVLNGGSVPGQASGPAPSAAGVMSGGLPLPPGVEAGPPTVASFRVNGRVIGLCPSGLPCMEQIRRAIWGR